MDRGMKIEKWKVYEQGDADEFCILMDDKRWVIAFRLNGELYREQQKPILDMIAAAPEMLAALKAGIEMRRAQASYFKDRTRENLIASKEAEKRFDDLAKYAIAKAEDRGDG